MKFIGLPVIYKYNDSIDIISWILTQSEQSKRYLLKSEVKLIILAVSKCGFDWTSCGYLTQESCNSVNFSVNYKPNSYEAGLLGERHERQGLPVVKLKLARLQGKTKEIIEKRRLTVV